MTDDQGPEFHAPDAKQLRTSVLVASGIAVLVLFVAILPAEYGVDPTGIGNAFGFSQLNGGGAGGEAVAPSKLTADGFDVKTVAFTLQPGTGIEYKVTMDHNLSLLYEWTASEPLYYDLHSDQAGAAEDEFVSHAEGTTDADTGEIITPFSGQHGWYFSNQGSQPIDIELRFGGHYDDAGFL